MPDPNASPLAFFLTWTCYGTCLPGDARGWVDGATHELRFQSDLERERQARALLAEEPVTLDTEQRERVTAAIRDHCRFRGWELYAVNVRTRHVHAVVALGDAPDKALREFKAWSTRRLKEAYPARKRWWTEGGSKQYLWDDDDLAAAVTYVADFQ